MKKLLLGLTLLTSMSSFAMITDQVTLSKVVSYHAANPDIAEKHKISSSDMNMFNVKAETSCSGGELVDWRVKQGDKLFKECMNRKYRNAIKKAGYSTNIESDDMYTENIILSEFLKNKVLEEENIKLKTDQYGNKSVDLTASDLTIKKLRDAQYRLELLIENNYK